MRPQFGPRLAQLRHTLAMAGMDALLVFSLDNLRYLFNYAGEAACAIVTQRACYLITDYRFTEEAREQCVLCEVVCRDRDNQSLGQALGVLLRGQGAHAVLFEADLISVSQWQAIALDNPETDFIASAGLIEEQRKYKDEWEVAQISAAAAIADAALAALMPCIRLGVSERALALELDYQLQLLGSEGLSFPTILGFGERSALPHCIPSARQLQAGELILVDFGAVVNGYRSDMTRTFVAGTPDPRQKAMYDTVAHAQRAAIEQVRAGAPARQVNAAATAVLADSPFADYAGKGIGHGLGIKLHEHPFIGPHCGDTLAEHYVVTIEPGLYVPGFGGVRIEDDVLVTAAGCRLLSGAPKQFAVAV